MKSQRKANLRPHGEVLLGKRARNIHKTLVKERLNSFSLLTGV